MSKTGTGVALLVVATLIACADEGLRGTITSVDEDGRTIVVNGQTFVVPSDVTVNWPDLDPGDQILLRYQEKNGGKEITVIEPEADD